MEDEAPAALSARFGLCRGVQHTGPVSLRILVSDGNQEKEVSLRTLSADNAFPIACRSVSPSVRPNIARIL
jgi:hypothetical protein